MYSEWSPMGCFLSAQDERALKRRAQTTRQVVLRGAGPGLALRGGAGVRSSPGRSKALAPPGKGLGGGLGYFATCFRLFLFLFRCCVVFPLCLAAKYRATPNWWVGVVVRGFEPRVLETNWEATFPNHHLELNIVIA